MLGVLWVGGVLRCTGCPHGCIAQQQLAPHDLHVYAALPQGHLARVGEERCAFVRCMVFANAAMRRREALAREADNWLEEAGALPPGESLSNATVLLPVGSNSSSWIACVLPPG